MQGSQSGLLGNHVILSTTLMTSISSKHSSFVLRLNTMRRNYRNALLLPLVYASLWQSHYSIRI